MFESAPRYNFENMEKKSYFQMNNEEENPYFREPMTISDMRPSNYNIPSSYKIKKIDKLGDTSLGDSFRLTEKWLETKATLAPFKNIGLSLSKAGSRSQSVLPSNGSHTRPDDEKPYFTKMVDGRQVFIEDKVIFP